MNGDNQNQPIIILKIKMKIIELVFQYKDILKVKKYPKNSNASYL
jgi:hypothetical protein